MKTFIQNAQIINEGRTFKGSVLIDGELISAVIPADNPTTSQQFDPSTIQPINIIDATGKYLIPGVIDDQVHFREPGLTHKGDIQSESRAAVAGGVTSFMDMPNTNPQTTTLENLEWKFRRAAEVSAANYSFFFGGTNDNFSEIKNIDRSRVPGIKLFLGSSTGNMLVDDTSALERFFGNTDMLIAIHAEKEEIIRRNRDYYISKFGDNLDISFHSKIRNEAACYASSSEAVELAHKLGTRLHILHISTAKELSLLDKGKISDRRITGEACVHHLWFCDDDYKQFGTCIKWNPSIKTAIDRDALQMAVKNDIITNVATDHAPHLISEKSGSCLTAASGGPLVQHSLLAMLDLADGGIFSREKVVEQMSHNPAELYHIDRRGYIREGYYADLVLIDPTVPTTVTKGNLLYKCGWSPFENYTFKNSVWKTFVNGREVYSDDGIVDNICGMELNFL